MALGDGRPEQLDQLRLRIRAGEDLALPPARTVVSLGERTVAFDVHVDEDPE